MGKKNKITPRSINKKFNESCSNGKRICPYLMKPNDEPTQFATLGVRCILAFAGWVVLGFKMDGKSVFNSVFLYFSPLLIDYLRFKPTTKWRSRFKNGGLFFSGLFLCVSFLGFMGILEAVNVNNETIIKITNDFIAFKFINIKFLWVWIFMGMAPVMTIIDYFAYETPVEVILVDKECIA